MAFARRAALVASTILVLAGCDRALPPPAAGPAAQPAAPPPPPVPVDLPGPGMAPAPTAAASSAPATPPAAAPGTDSAAGRGEPTVPPTSPGPPAQSTLREAKPVKLSAGVALAQTLPGGTAMLFSVDYEFVVGRPGQSSKYYLNVLSKGAPLRLPVRLADRGTLIPPPAPQLRPQHGPFRAYLSEVGRDGSERAVSETLTLR